MSTIILAASLSVVVILTAVGATLWSLVATTAGGLGGAKDDQAARTGETNLPGPTNGSSGQPESVRQAGGGAIPHTYLDPASDAPTSGREYVNQERDDLP